MSELAISQRSTSRRWRMTNNAWHALVEELGRLRSDVARLASTTAPDDGVVSFPLVSAARRLGVLSAVLDASERSHVSDGAVIGCRVTVLEEDGDPVAYSLVYPGDGDPIQGWISADSPLGAAVMGCRPGDRVEVVAPAGRRVVTVVSVE